MAILARISHQHARKNAPSQQLPQNGGYIAEFASLLQRDLWAKWPQRSLKAIIVNAGGLDPVGLKRHLETIQEVLLKKEGGGKPQWRVAAVYGDDMRQNLLSQHWEGFSIVDQSENLPHALKKQLEVSSTKSDKQQDVPKTKLLSANVYIGARGIVEALRSGANIIVTGRCVDSALALAPLMYELNWDFDKDYDAMASASLVGHIIECGCQCTGGNFTDWKDSLQGHTSGWTNVGFPIAEFNPVDLSCVITKLPNTGGIVNEATVTEQILYEIQDPANYILPDVIVDLSQVQVKYLGENRVRVSRARGKAPPRKLKICLTHTSKYKMEATLMIGGLDAAAKAREVGRAILARCNEILSTKYHMNAYSDTYMETLGAEHTYGPHSLTSGTSREVILRLVVVHENPKALYVFAREIAPAATGMAPGITGAGSGRPREQPLIEYAAYLIDRDHAPLIRVELPQPKSVTVELQEKSRHYTNEISSNADDVYQGQEPTLDGMNDSPDSSDQITVSLHSVCHARSGDKGPTCNIGIRCRDARLYPILSKQLTAQKIHDTLFHLSPSRVNRYALPGIHAWNFLIGGSILGGGGLSSLRTDRQGKALAQQCLSVIRVTVPREIYNDIRRERRSLLQSNL